MVPHSQEQPVLVAILPCTAGNTFFSAESFVSGSKMLTYCCVLCAIFVILFRFVQTLASSHLPCVYILINHWEHCLIIARIDRSDHSVVTPVVFIDMEACF